MYMKIILRLGYFVENVISSLRIVSDLFQFPSRLSYDGFSLSLKC